MKAQSYALEAEQVDGMDVLAVEEAVRRAIKVIRSSGQPYFLELLTYRFRAHSMYDAELYRDKREVEEWKQRDPIATFGRQLREWALLDDVESDKIELQVSEEVRQAVTDAEAGPWEPVDDLLADVQTPRARATS
jgi:TPP-dependent pyruvate/acetoin dehydrogenase alpha subunit